eukprot:scaffold14477_cov130-Isochrysis_galbana.AAC.1
MRCIQDTFSEGYVSFTHGISYDYDRAERFRLTGASARGIARSRPAPRSGMVLPTPARVAASCLACVRASFRAARAA